LVLAGTAARSSYSPWYTSEVGRRVRQIVIGVIGTVLVWIGVLLVIGWTADGCARDRAAARLAGSMRASVTIEALDLGLVTGAIALSKVHIVKNQHGYFRLDIARVEVDVLPLGLALLSDSVGDVVVRGVDVEVSALGALDLRGGSRDPVTFDSLDLSGAHVSIEATSLIPGLAHVDVTIERAIAGPTTLRTPLSWLFSLRELVAQIELPGNLSARLDYRGGKLRLSGGMFGQTPIEIPFDIPVLEPARELEQLAAMGKQLVSELTEVGAERWLQDRAKRELLDRFAP
jgi:hypothetical protein